MGIPHPWRTLSRTAQSAGRYAELTRIAARHGLAGTVARGRDADLGQLARQLRPALEEAGPIFVKLGQVLSTRTDLLPEPVTTELASLQDQVPPEPWPHIRAVLAEELGRDPDQVFSHIDQKPLASASLAQAHAACRTDGSAVILKVQRPGADELVSRDLEMIRRLARRLESRAEWARAYRLADLGRGFADAVAEELDFRCEARNIADIAAAAPQGAAVLIPVVHTDISSRRLLVMNQFDGVSVREAGPLMDRLGADRRGLARELLHTVLDQVLLQGAFHADPHPGNVLFLTSGQQALIDFGSVGRLDVLQRAGLQRLLSAVARQDHVGLYDAVTDLAVSEVTDEDELERALAAFMSAHLGNGMTPDAAFMRDLLTMLGRAGIAFPPAIAGVFRALITLDGTVRIIDPGFDMAAESRHAASRYAAEQLSPRSLHDAASTELLALLPMLRKLPRRADRISAALAQGRFTTRLRLFGDEHDVSVITELVHRAVLSLIGSALGVISGFLLVAGGSPTITTGLSLLHLLGYIGLFLGVILLSRVVLEIGIFRRR
jgi:ubiquinone biosynthesis protein